MREKANEEKITELKKQHETPKNCITLSETKVNQGVWNNLDESAKYTDLKFQKVLKSLIKGIIVVVSEVNELMGNSGLQKEDTVSALMDGVLFLGKCQPGVKLSMERADETSAQYKLQTPLQPVKSSQSRAV